MASSFDLHLLSSNQWECVAYQKVSTDPQYFNVANQFLPDLPSGTTFGQGPFREVRILVDGQVAGIAFPYAVIFTGGIIPTAWR